MIKVDQTVFGVGKGNCLPACIATITGLPLLSIPNFCELYGEGEWYQHFIRWCHALGLAPWSVTMAGEVPTFVDMQLRYIPWIACGHTARGMHCCVYVGNQLFHDPNPCRDGLTELVDATFFLSEKIVPLKFP